MKNFIIKNKFYIGAILLFLILVIGRIYYSFMVYNQTFSSGDSADTILKSLYIEKSFFGEGLSLEKSDISNKLFSVPVFIPYSLAVFSKFLNLDLYRVSYLITPLVTIMGFLILYYLLYRRFGLLIAFSTVLLISLNSYITFYSTEPERAPYIISFFIFSLYYLSKTGQKNLVLSLFFLAITCFLHTTGIIFIIGYLINYFYINRKVNKRYFNKIFLGGILFIVFLILTSKFLNIFFYYDLNQTLGLSKHLGAVSGELSAVLSNILSGGQHFGFFPFIRGIKAQIGGLIFYLGIIGFIISLFIKKYKDTSLIFSFFLIFIAFSIKWEASSHGSRYPFYINWLFILSAVISLDYIFHNIKNKFLKGALGCIIFLIIFVTNTFYNNYVAGFRHIYKSNKEIGNYLGNNISINTNNKILVMGWPNTIHEIVAIEGLDSKKGIIEYGWKYPEDLVRIDPEFCIRNHIKYFLYERTGNDGFLSFDIIYKNLYNHLLPIKEVRDGSRYIILYEITP